MGLAKYRTVGKFVLGYSNQPFLDQNYKKSERMIKLMNRT